MWVGLDSDEFGWVFSTFLGFSRLFSVWHGFLENSTLILYFSSLILGFSSLILGFSWEFDREGRKDGKEKGGGESRAG